MPFCIACFARWERHRRWILHGFRHHRRIQQQVLALLGQRQACHSARVRITEQDAWARSLEVVAAAFDHEQEESDAEEYQSDPDRRSKKRSPQLCPFGVARLGVVCWASNLSLFGRIGEIRR